MSAAAISTRCRSRWHCRLPQRVLRAPRPASGSQRSLSTSGRRPQAASSSSSPQPLNPSSLLSKPTWSVRSLLPPTASTTTSPTDSSSAAPTPTVTPQTLRHLLRLSALPPPSSPDEERRMLDTLASQLHFVRAIQGVDTAGVAPLRAIRDETAAGLREQTIGLRALRDALANEDVVGHARRPRRRREEKVDAGDVEDWDVLGGAGMTVGGRYFVVRSGGETSTEQPGAGLGAADGEVKLDQA